MRFRHGLLAMELALAEHERIRKSRAATGDVDRATTSIVERRKVGQPAVRVPCPAGNRTVPELRVSVWTRVTDDEK